MPKYNFPDGFTEALVAARQASPRHSWAEVAEIVLRELNVENVTGLEIADMARQRVETATGKRRPRGGQAETPIADNSMVAEVWVKRKKGTYRVKPEIGKSLTETLSEFEGGALDGEEGKTLIEALREIVESTEIRPYEPIEVKTEREESIAAIVSDMHVGLNPNPSRRAMYPVEYNAEIFNANLTKVFNACKFNADYCGAVGLLSVSDLGDGLDGYSRKTTRGGHELEQSMDNIEMFQTFVQGKLQLAENLIHSGIAKRYVFNNVSNDNHAGDFAAIANMTIQMILERAYPKEVVSFRVMRKPLEHFTYGDHTFILMHGKDQEYQFKGLPLVLNPQTEKYIRKYIDYNNIKSKYIHCFKGDLHQAAYSKCETFDYRSFMSFAPPSQWIQCNFPGSYSGFAVQRIPKWSNEIQHTDYMLEFERVKEEVQEYVY